MLASRLAGRELRLADLPETDLRDPALAREAVAGCEKVVHLAWNIRAEEFRSGGYSSENALMVFNMLSAAVDGGVRRFVFASSVHAHAFAPAPAPLAELPHTILGAEAERAPVPDSPYGASKLFGEAMCRWAAISGLETVAIRFGGVNAHDTPPAKDPDERKVWLSHRDCAAAVEAALDRKLEHGSTAFVAVSDNAGRVHSFENAFGWVPRDGAPPE